MLIDTHAHINFENYTSRLNEVFENALNDAKETGATLTWSENPVEAVKNNVFGTLNVVELAAKYEAAPPKGECVIVLSGKSEANEAPEESMEEMLLRLMRGGMSAKDAAKQASLMLDVPKSEAYAKANELKQMV